MRPYQNDPRESLDPSLFQLGSWAAAEKGWKLLLLLDKREKFHFILEKKKKKAGITGKKLTHKQKKAQH